MYNLDITSSKETGLVRCEHYDAEANISMDRGDILGFLSRNTVRVALVGFLNSTILSAPSILEGEVINIESDSFLGIIQQQEVGTTVQRAKSLIRVILSKYIILLYAC